MSDHKNCSKCNKSLLSIYFSKNMTWCKSCCIVPHSKFKYTSMEDQSFQKCWALINLRPYSAKQNLLDGNRR